MTGVTEKLFMCQMFMFLFRPLSRPDLCGVDSGAETPTSFASLPAIYRSLEALRAENRGKVSESSSRTFGREVSKKPRKSRKAPPMTLFGDFSETFRPFPGFFETPGRKVREDFFETCFAVFGPEGRETAVDGRQGRNTS